MKRYTCLMLVLSAALFTVVGCGKSRDEKKRKPVDVVEPIDFIIAPEIDEMEKVFAKRAKKDPIPIDEAPADKALREQREKEAIAAKEKQDKEDRAKYLGHIGAIYLKFLTAGEANKLTEETLKLRLRRTSNKDANVARKRIENAVFGVMLEADLSYPHHILAYEKTAEAGFHQVILVNQKIDEVKDQGKDGLTVRLLKQKLETVLAHYKRYSTENPRTADNFNAYLKTNAQPALASAVSNSTIKVNVGAQLGTGQMVACFTKADFNIGIPDHSVLGIQGDGFIRPYTPAERGN